MATGDSLLQWAPQSGEPPASAYATLDTRNAHLVADFDAGTDESLMFSAVLPQNYAGGGITVYVHWAASSATSGDVVWNSAFERIGAAQQDIDTDGFATAQSSTGTANATSGNVVVTSIAHTDGAQIDSVAVGEAFRLKITRDADNASDTMTGDAELLKVEIRET